MVKLVNVEEVVERLAAPGARAPGLTDIDRICLNHRDNSFASAGYAGRGEDGPTGASGVHLSASQFPFQCSRTVPQSSAHSGADPHPEAPVELTAAVECVGGMEREPGQGEAASVRAGAPTETVILLLSWGANSYGQLGLGHKEDMLEPQRLNDFCDPKRIKLLTGGGGHSAVVTDGGELFVCGQNKDGQLGLGHTEDVLSFVPCTPLAGLRVLQVSCGWDFTLLLTENGQVLSCGSNAFGQLGLPPGPRRQVTPQVIELLSEKVVCTAAGMRHALAVTESGLVFQWGTGLASTGRRACPETPLPPFLTAKEPCRVTGLENSKVKMVVTGSCHSASLTDEGDLYVWGSNKHGQLVSPAAFLPTPQKIEATCFQNEKVTMVWSGWTHLVARTETGKIFTWGRADYGQLGRKVDSHERWKGECELPLSCTRTLTTRPSSLPCLAGMTEVACGSEHNLAVMGNTCYSWGWNEHGMCGDGTEDNVWAPKPVESPSVALWLLVGCGAGHSFALCQASACPSLPWSPQDTESSSNPWRTHSKRIQKEEAQTLFPHQASVS
ncbi:secretion-regulating guanine nucleotide exchange factor [Trichosurus vulpecula]|uniref:secretion-regulating guanine nucleotide exchange factor n=1 Tax=Trichosurus vulpecula TaxID=9337 RepID=UPI00186B1181|nr:secretion-regulating guanine nucleotide exchange factor [Trichosurus vulpecula]